MSKTVSGGEFGWGGTAHLSKDNAGVLRQASSATNVKARLNQGCQKSYHRDNWLVSGEAEIATEAVGLFTH